QRVATRLTMKPTTMAAIENRRKNDEPSRPNCEASSLSSVMIGTAARPTTILSAKFTSMKRNSKKVMPQAPFCVSACVAGAVMMSPCDILPSRCYACLPQQRNRTFRSVRRDGSRSHYQQPATDHDHVVASL